MSTVFYYEGVPISTVALGENTDDGDFSDANVLTCVHAPWFGLKDA